MYINSLPMEPEIFYCIEKGAFGANIVPTVTKMEAKFDHWIQNGAQSDQLGGNNASKRATEPP